MKQYSSGDSVLESEGLREAHDHPISYFNNFKAKNFYTREEWAQLYAMLEGHKANYIGFMANNGDDKTILNGLLLNPGVFWRFIIFFYELSLEDMGLWVNAEGLHQIIFKWRMNIGH